MPASLLEAYKSFDIDSDQTRSSLADLNNPFFNGYNSISEKTGPDIPESHAATISSTIGELDIDSTYVHPDNEINSQHDCESLVHSLLSCDKCRKLMVDLLSKERNITSVTKTPDYNESTNFGIEGFSSILNTQGIPISTVIICVILAGIFLLLLIEVIMRIVQRKISYS